MDENQNNADKNERANDEFHYGSDGKNNKKEGVNIGIDSDGIHIDASVKSDDGKREEKRKSDFTRKWNSFPFPVVALIAFLLCGFLAGGWAWSWLFFFLIPIYYLAGNPSLKSFAYASYPIFCAIIFFVLGIFFELWHPGWLIFLSIPLFYTICEAVYKHKFFGIYSLVCVGVYLILGFCFGLWHPWWVIFLTIPIAEWFFTQFGKVKKS